MLELGDGYLTTVSRIAHHMAWQRLPTFALRHVFMSNFTTFLFARPSFFEGVARVLDFGNTLCEYNRAATPEEADARATWCDWAAIGEDYVAVLRQGKREAHSSPHE